MDGRLEFSVAVKLVFDIESDNQCQVTASFSREMLGPGACIASRPSSLRRA